MPSVSKKNNYSSPTVPSMFCFKNYYSFISVAFLAFKLNFEDMNYMIEH